MKLIDFGDCFKMKEGGTMLVLGPTLILIVSAIAFVLFMKFITVENHSIRVVREEQLYNRYEEERNRKASEQEEGFNQRRPISNTDRNDRYLKGRKNNFLYEDTTDRNSLRDEDTERDEGIV